MSLPLNYYLVDWSTDHPLDDYFNTIQDDTALEQWHQSELELQQQQEEDNDQ